MEKKTGFLGVFLKISEFMGAVTKISVIVITIAGGSFLLYLGIKDTWEIKKSGAMLIEKFDIPEKLSESGYSGEVLSSHFMDEITRIKAQRKEKIEAAHIRSTVVFPDIGYDSPEKNLILMPSSPSLDLMIPNVKLSYLDAMAFIVTKLNLVEVVKGDIVCVDEEKKLFDITMRSGGEVFHSAQSIPMQQIDEEIRRAAISFIAREATYNAAYGLYCCGGYYNRKKCEKVLERHVEKIKESDPDFVAKLEFLGLVYLENLEYDSAIECFNRLILLKPEDSNGYFLLGAVYSNMRDYNQAIPFYEKALAFNPSNPKYICELAICHIALKHLDIAEKVLRDAQHREIFSEHIYIAFAMLYQRLKQYNESLHFIQLAKNLDSKLPQIYTIAAINYRNMHNYDLAVKNLNYIIAKYPNYHWAYFNLGRTYYEAKDYEKAEECYNDAIKLVPRFAWGHVRLGEVYAEDGKCENVEKCFKEAIRLDPFNKAIYSRYAKSLQKCGKCDLAAVQLEKSNFLTDEAAE